MSDGKVFVVMTVSGRVRELKAVDTIREVLESVYGEPDFAGLDGDRASRLFVDGRCVVEGGLADVAAEYGEFRVTKEDELFAECEAWVVERFGKKSRGQSS